ncbi:MAG: EscU/YscU/HrcU family type III secretion system export apparatus switch protein [Rhizomicrobium sp.]
MEEGEQDRSELPTTFKLARAREKGTVARGADLGFLTGLAAFLGFFWIAGQQLGSDIASAVRGAWVGMGALADGPSAIFFAIDLLFSAVAKPLAFMAAVIFAVVAVFEVIQTGPVFSAEPMRPDFSRLNPAKGLKRLFSVRLLIETAKNIAKLCTYTTVGYLVIRGALRTDVGAITDGRTLLWTLASTGTRLLGSFLLVALFFATIDQLIVRRDFLKRMRMSRRDIRREAREREGDPRLKQKRKQLHAEFARQSQSVRAVRGADVLITNPEHIALALRYDRRLMAAPIVVSIGTNQFAQRLKRLAFIYNVPVVPDRALARELFRSARLNAAIPEHCFRAVADVYNGLRQKADEGSAEHHHVG